MKRNLAYTDLSVMVLFPGHRAGASLKPGYGRCGKE